MRAAEFIAQLLESGRRLELIREDAPPGAVEQWSALIHEMLRRHGLRLAPENKKKEKP